MLGGGVEWMGPRQPCDQKTATSTPWYCSKSCMQRNGREERWLWVNGNFDSLWYLNKQHCPNQSLPSRC